MKQHNCIERVRKKMMSKSSAIKGVRFDLSTIVSFQGNKQVGENKTGQTIWLYLTKTNRKGDKVEKQVKTFITHSHCPFCGKKYQ